MTQKQKDQFNRMRNALINISRNYQKPNLIRKSSEKQYGLDYTEALEMSYENIQSEASYAVKNVKVLK